ncbi:hypothetical protein [Isoptericola sp. NPDC055881]
MSTESRDVGHFAEHNRRTRAQKREDRITQVEVMAEDGWSLSSVARKFGWSPRRLTRYLDHLRHHDLVERLARNEGLTTDGRWRG